MAEFNLIDEPWIPCIDLNGQRVEHGIRDTILKAHELREICDDSPLVTVATHRLLLAILHRAIEGPSNFQDWKGLYASGAVGHKVIEKYLNSYRDRFCLISDTHPFFQRAGLEMKNAVSVNRLATECASGNNATLFDHCTDEEHVGWLPAQATRQLIACQSFALGFGRSGNAKIDGKEEVLPYSADAIALRGMSIWLQGATLFETLAINLVPIEDQSLPPWEMNDSHKHRDRLKGKKRTEVASLGVVDRLTWQSRLVRLLSNGETISKMFFTQGRSADKSPGDPMKVYRTSKKDGISSVPLNSEKSAWRDAHTIFMIPSANSQERRPKCFNIVARARSSGTIRAEKLFVAHVVGLASAPNKAGKFLLWRHEKMPVPAALLDHVDWIERLGRLLRDAEQAQNALNDRMRRIAKLYLSPESESSGSQQPDKEEVSRVTKHIDPRPAYWAPDFRRLS